MYFAPQLKVSMLLSQKHQNRSAPTAYKVVILDPIIKTWGIGTVIDPLQKFELGSIVTWYSDMLHCLMVKMHSQV